MTITLEQRTRIVNAFGELLDVSSALHDAYTTGNIPIRDMGTEQLRLANLFLTRLREYEDAVKQARLPNTKIIRSYAVDIIDG